MSNHPQTFYPPPPAYIPSTSFHLPPPAPPPLPSSCLPLPIPHPRHLLPSPCPIPYSPNSRRPLVVTSATQTQENENDLVGSMTTTPQPILTSNTATSATTTAAAVTDTTPVQMTTTPQPVLTSNTATSATPTVAAATNTTPLCQKQRSPSPPSSSSSFPSPRRSASARQYCVVIGDQGVIAGDSSSKIWNDYAKKSGLKLLEMCKFGQASENSLGLSLKLMKTRHDVKLVILSCTADICFHGKIIKSDWKKLISKIRETYPDALIVLGSIIFPLYGGLLKYNILCSNTEMKNAAAEKKKVTFVNLTNVTRRSYSKSLREYMYRSTLDPNTKCIRHIASKLFCEYDSFMLRKTKMTEKGKGHPTKEINK